MSWTTALSDLRVKLSDGPTDKLRAYKKVFGRLDGSNKLFKTFEYRRLTNFTTAAAPLGVYKNDVILATSVIATDDPATGFFSLTTAPADGDVLECAYYAQWFLDTELQEFLRIATDWCLGFDDWTGAPNGLFQAILNYASAEAYQKLSIRWAEHTSESFRLEDAPDPKNFSIVKQYSDTSIALRKEATVLRDDYYTRKGQSKAPAFGILKGRVRDVAPSR